MQTFLPYPDLLRSCVVLDDRRLGKQRVETFQVLRALTWPSYAWKNHPAVRMWRGFVPGLVEYGLASCTEWTRRGYADSVADQLLGWTGGEPPTGAPLPPWFGVEALHLSHRSSLLRKDPAHYRPLFGPDEPDDLPYLWPPDLFPRWPVRAGDEPLDVATAARRLGLPAAHPAQAAVAEAAAAGRDALLVARTGRGGSTAGLLAGLVTPGTTLLLQPPLGDPAPPAPDVPLPPARPAAVPDEPGDRPPPLARPPGPEDLDAMAAEAQPPEFAFATGLPASAPPDLGLVVLDRLPDVDEPALSALRGRRPLLVVVDRADAAERDRLAAATGLRDPLHAGLGWDVPARLEVAAAATAAERRRLLAALVRDGGPAVVVTDGRDRADRVATGLLGAGLRAAVWAPPPMRGTRAAASVAAWRSRRLDALVVPAGSDPPLGRGRRPLVVDAVGDGPEAFRDRAEALAPDRAVLLVEPDDPLLQGCVRARLLARYGEPVDGPCGRCSGCPPLS